MDPDLLDAATQARMLAAPSGAGAPVRLRLGALAPGDVGLLEAEVRAVGPVRTYARKRGGEGLLQRVTLADLSGEADLVLWDDEVRLSKGGPLQPGAHVRIHGPLVRPGRTPSSAPELGLAGAEVVPLPPGADATVAGLLVAVGPTRPVGDPPALRFTCELTLDTPRGPLRVAVWDGAVRAALAAGLGSRVLVHGRPNPFLDGWWTATALAPVEGAPAPGPLERNP